MRSNLNCWSEDYVIWLMAIKVYYTSMFLCIYIFKLWSALVSLASIHIYLKWNLCTAHVRTIKNIMLTNNDLNITPYLSIIIKNTGVGARIHGMLWQTPNFVLWQIYAELRHCYGGCKQCPWENQQISTSPWNLAWRMLPTCINFLRIITFNSKN